MLLYSYLSLLPYVLHLPQINSENKPSLSEDALINKKQVEKDKLQKVEQQTKDVLQEASEEMQRAVKLSQEKGSSNRLSNIPLKEMGFTLNKKEFHDAVSL